MLAAATSFKADFSDWTTSVYIRKLKFRSLVVLFPLLSVQAFDPELVDGLPSFRRRMDWFLQHRPDLASLVSRWHVPGQEDRRLFALARGHRMKSLLKRM